MNEYTFNSVSDCDSVPFDWIFYEQDYKQDVFPTHGHNYSYAFAQTPTPMVSLVVLTFDMHKPFPL